MVHWLFAWFKSFVLPYFYYLILFLAVHTCFTTTQAQGQTQAGDATIRGFVYDKATGEPLIFVLVLLQGTNYGASTDINGFFSIAKVPAGNYTLYCRPVGYDTLQVPVTLAPNDLVNKQLYIAQANTQLQTVEITAERTEKQTEVRASVIKVTPKQISKIPTVGGEPDLAQYLQVLPGVVSTGDQGGQLYIRGGAPIQTKVMLDGLPIYNPFHSIGLFSVFETDLIRNVEVHTGGFSALHGGRISAVIDVTSRDGNRKKHSGKIGASTFSGKALFEGPIKRFNESTQGTSASYMLSAKTSYLDRTSKMLYDYIYEDGLPYNFTDLYGKISLNLGNGSKINFSGYNFDDNVRYLGKSKLHWGSFGSGVNFVAVPGVSKVLIDGHFSFSKYNISLTESDGLPRTSSIGGFNSGVNFSYFLPKGDLKYGIEISGYSTQFKFYTPLGYGIDQDQNTTEIGGFLNYKAIVGDKKLLLEPGLRINYYASLAAFALEPRFALKYNITDRSRLKLASGYYSQNFISTRSDKDVVNLFSGFLSAPEGALDNAFGNEAPNNLQYALHGILGYEFDATRYLDFNIETYYKYFNQLIDINRSKLLNQDPDYVMEVGHAYGFDVLAKYDHKPWYLWAVYSLGYVTRNNGDQVYPPHYDRRHNVNLLASYAFGKGQSWEISARWNFGSGFPFTKTQGFYESLNFNGGIDVDYLTQNGQLEIIYSEKINDGRLPSYHRLDLSIKKEWALGTDARLEATASVTNAYNRDNIFYFDRIHYERINQLPILPSIGVAFSF